MLDDPELDLIEEIGTALSVDGMWTTTIPVHDDAQLASVAWCAERAAAEHHIRNMRFMTQLHGSVYDVRVVDLGPVLDGDELAQRRLQHRLSLVDDYNLERTWPAPD